MSLGAIIAIILVYLGAMALLAQWAESKSKAQKLLKSSWVYSLSLAVYCTAWTFYGSIGRAVNTGLDFLTIYIGPLVGCLLLYYVLRKIVRISRTQKITSLADFLSNRYGKSISLGALVASFSLIGVIPYIALQLKSIREGIVVLSGSDAVHLGGFSIESGFIIALAIALFTVWFGLRKIDLTEKHRGVVAVIAVESLVKLIALVVIAIYALTILRTSELGTMPKPPADNGQWTSLLIISLFAFFLLPRQWQMAVTENEDERHIKQASWQFPTYLLLINACVLPIALAGMANLPSGENPDYFVLSLPLAGGHTSLALLGFVGGFAAASGMIIVSTISLATMLTNNIILPLSFKLKLLKDPKGFVGRIALIRKASVFAIAGLAYSYYKFLALDAPLVSIGLVSFVAVAQFAPSTIGALFWKKGNKRGAFWGIVAGGLVWFFVFIAPNLAIFDTLFEVYSNRSSGTGSLIQLEPNNVTSGVFWSLILNSLVYIGLSIFSKQNSTQLNQAELFVDAFKYSSNLEENLFWRGQVKNVEVKKLLSSFLGKTKSKQALRIFENRYSVSSMDNTEFADRKFVMYAENVLASVIGSSSARIVVSSVTSEEEIRMEDVVSILKESKEILELNQKLVKASKELTKAKDKLTEVNQELLHQDELKNEFLYTITHEIRTPITSIRAFTEILQEDEDVSLEDRQRFIGIMSTELERLSKLISQVLDLEKYESGKYELNFQETDINELVLESIAACKAPIMERNVQVETFLQESILPLSVDKDKLKQVLINLISNAAKYASEEEGRISISTYFVNNHIRVNVKDNGSGISGDQGGQIFDKFYQIRKGHTGNGLGLAISKEIVHMHEGEIWLDSEYTEGAKFCISLPKIRKT